MTNQFTVAATYVALSGDTTPTAEEMYKYLEQVDTYGIKLATANIITDNDALGTAFFSDALTDSDKLDLLYDQLFGREPDAEGKAYWLDQLENNSQVVNETSIAAALLRGAEVNEDQTDWLYLQTTSAAAADELAAYTPDTTPVVEGETFSLTDGRDDVTGTADADTIKGYVGQNQDGALANALATGDMIDGGGSTDTLIASLTNDEYVDSGIDNFAPMPVIDNVENIRIKALEEGVAVAGATTVTLDADDITGEEHYASDSSRADLVITNVDIESTQITNDIVLEMKDTQQFSDLEVYFNEQDLKAAPDVVVASAQVVIQVADGAQTDGTAPISNMTFDLNFTQDGTTYSFENIESTDGTYAGLVTAIEVALAAEGLTQYTVALGDEFTTFTTDAGKSIELDYTANYVTITDDEGTAFSDIEFAPEQKDGTDVAILLAQSNVNTDAVTTTNMVESTVIFDNVGRGSNGGEFIVGSTSSSKTSTGVERINVIVENSSVVADISSTNDALNYITLTNGTVKGDFVLANADFDAAPETDAVYGNVDQVDLVKEGLTSIVATDFDGDIVLGRDNDIVDLVTLSAAVNGDVTYNADLNDGSYKSITGAGNDTIDIQADAATLTISTGNGTNTVTLTEDGAASTATITGGTGVDTINGGAVAVTVDAGAGNDVVYAENTGSKALLTYNTLALTTATAATDTSTAVINNGVEFLYNVDVQVVLSTNGLAAGNLTNGYESELITITPDSGYLTSQADVNAAIMEAINEDSVLSTIAVASVNAAGLLQVDYLVDGTQVATSLDVIFTAPTTANSATIDAAIEAEFEETYKDSSVFPATNAAAQQTNAIAAANAALIALGADVSAVFTIDLAGVSVDNILDSVDFTTDFGITDSFIVAGGATTDAAIVAELVTAAATDGGLFTITAGSTDTEIILTASTAYDTSSMTVGVTNNFGELDSAPTTTTFTADTNGVDASGSDSVDSNNVNVVNGNEGNDVIVLSSDATVGDTVEFTGYSQGDDTIVHFETTKDKLDFTSYLTNTTTDSLSTESVVDIDNTAVASEVFTANSINLIDFTDLDVAVGSATTSFADLTIAELTAALNTDADNVIATNANVNGVYQTDAVSVLVIHNDEALVGNDGEYAAYEVSYADVAVAAGTAKDFTVTLIGTFDLGDTAVPSTLAVGDFAL